MSGAGFMRLVKNVGDSFSKIGGKKGDVDTVSIIYSIHVFKLIVCKIGGYLRLWL